jgi:hypothetical protein
MSLTLEKTMLNNFEYLPGDEKFLSINFRKCTKETFYLLYENKMLKDNKR